MDISAIRLLVGLFPVLLFLLALIYLDSYKLVRLHTILVTILLGAAATGLSYVLSRELQSVLGWDFARSARYIAPGIEEIVKGIILAYYMRSHRIGFLVDAAIFGFAVGCGFALIENVYYWTLLPDANLGLWVVRGFGTAIMHGGTTAILGMTAKALSDRRESMSPIIFLPGLMVATVVHSAFNHFFLTPVLSALGILLGLPPLIFLVFRRSESALRNWLDVGFDADTELLERIHSGKFTETRVGQYLHSLRSNFRGEVVADLLCYLRLHVELSLRAKGLLMMREAGLRVPPSPEVRATFHELEYLERSIGLTGKLALAPFLHFSDKELWQLYMLRE